MALHILLRRLDGQGTTAAAPRGACCLFALVERTHVLGLPRYQRRSFCPGIAAFRVLTGAAVAGAPSTALRGSEAVHWGGVLSR